MVLRLSIPSLLASGLALLLATASSEAGEPRWQRHHARDRDHSERHRPREYVNIIPGTGTYSGSITVYHVRGIGTSTWLQGNVSAPVAIDRQVAVKIIHVENSSPSSACSMEAGVCVIRP